MAEEKVESRVKERSSSCVRAKFGWELRWHALVQLAGLAGCVGYLPNLYVHMEPT